MIEPTSIPGLTQDCQIQPIRTCLGCFIETKGVSNIESNINLKMADMNREYNACPISDTNMQSISTSETGSYEDQLLSDQLLTFSAPKTQLVEKKDMEKMEGDLTDPAPKNLYEGLLLDKCNGEDGLLTNSNQDWGYFESFISESKMELLDLCSKNELSVNLFSEEDVDNYMFDDDDDSTLSSDVCSLKIRYESFQDNMREKTNVLQEETQFNFFPSVLVNCTKKEGGVVKRAVDELTNKPEELGFQPKSRGDGNESSIEQTHDYSSEMNYFIDSSYSPDDSGEYSDDSSATISSFDTFQDNTSRNSRKNASCSNHLNYGLRAKRKVRYSDDYLYYVDSIDGEKTVEKREKPPIGPKEELDDDWCPKKRRKSSRKDPPVIIKYVIVNRFKGDKCMAVNLARIDSTDTTVSLNEETVSKYEKLAPLKDFWQQKQREREEQLKLAAGDKDNSHHHAFGSSPPKRKRKLANRLRIQRIQTVEHSPNTQGHFASDPRQEVASTDETASIGRPLTIATSCASALDSNDIIHTAARKSRSQEIEERRIGNKIFRIKKFRSEAQLRRKKMRDLAESSMTDLLEVGMLQKNTDTVGGAEDRKVRPAAHSPHLCESQTANSTEKYAFVSATCSPNKEASSENVAASVPVIPGGYLQTLLEASDSSVGSTGISFFAQQPHIQHSLDPSLEKRQFTSVQLAQSCVLSPLSESELQQSPQNCSNLTQMWHTQLGPNHQFTTADIAESAVQPNSFTGEMPMPMSGGLTVSVYSQLSLESNRMLYEKNYMPEQPLTPDAEFQACQGQPQFQRATLHTDNGCLISFDSSQSLKSCEKDGEDDVNENFLAHCSAKLVIQQSTDAITPLRESTDLLDISNFTPDKFRHASLSELSPPETPNLSPHVIGHEMKIAGKASDLQDGAKRSCTKDMDWNCNVIERQDLTRYSVDDQEYRLHIFNSEDNSSLGTKEENQAKFDGDMMSAIKGTKSKRKNTTKQSTGQCTKKSKAPRAPKSDKGKSPCQASRASKKLKALLDEKGGKGQIEGSAHPPKDGGSEEWTGVGWSEGKIQVQDEQREFEEPSNILSNIVSGMAEVQRFMMAPIEPIWGPSANICLPSESNSLKLKTLKILAGTSSDPKKKSTVATTGGTKGKKTGTKNGKNQAKLNGSLPFFPQLALGGNIFDKSNLGVPGINGPAHKKMYRHKTSAKFPRIENLKGTRPEREPNKDISLMASFEKLSRPWMTLMRKLHMARLVCLLSFLPVVN